MTRTDVAVIGGGPAGAVAACLLARGGWSVLLLDPRVNTTGPSKPGDALPGAALRLLRACDLPLPSVAAGHRTIGGNVSAWGSDTPIYRDFITEPDGPGWRLDRAAFEAGLLAAARDAGAVVRPGALLGARREGDVWQVRLREGGITARWLVDATGRAAAVARRLGARRLRDEPVVALVAYAHPSPLFSLERSLVETTQMGWWYAALLPDRRAVFMLHTRPEIAARLRASPQAWRAALDQTRHVVQAFPQPALGAPPRGFDACGAWLDPVHGEGWIACGDAALSFDPCAAQGIFNALYGGMAAARTLVAMQAGDAAAPAAYAARCAEIRRAYRQQAQAAYAQERRWPEAPFWRRIVT